MLFLLHARIFKNAKYLFEAQKAGPQKGGAFCKTGGALCEIDVYSAKHGHIITYFTLRCFVSIHIFHFNPRGPFF